MDPELELYLFEKYDSWSTVYNQICQEAQQRYELSHSDARRTEFRSRNRYKDISPFDHSRIRLEYNNIDYINASRVDVPEAKRSYILTQGPLAITFSHFWLMCWEKQSSCIVMLNKLVEKKQVKCHPYFPTNATKPLILKDVGLKITLLSRVGDDGELLPDNEDPDSDANSKQFVISSFIISKLNIAEERIIKHFHFTAWPDFGIPESPEIFLRFLFSIRDEGLLNDTANHPPIIHCSAGVGRSGAFCLVDACLSIAEHENSVVNVNLRSTLLNMRRYRMALIQAPSQLKFSYQATVDGLKKLNLLESNRNLEEICREAEQQYLARLASFEKEEENVEDDVIVNKVKSSYQKINKNRNHRVSFGRIVPHAASIEDPDFLWFLNNDAFNVEPVLIKPGRNLAEVDDEHGEVDEERGEVDDECGVDNVVKVGACLKEDDDGEYNTEEDDDDSNEVHSFAISSETNANIKRKPLEERMKKTRAEMNLMCKRQEECALFRDYRKKQFKLKFIGWSIVVAVISIIVYNRWMIN